MGLSQGDESSASWRRRWLVASIAGLSILAQILGSHALTGLRFERVGISQGEVWRLLSGHLVHLGWPHLAMNLVGLALVGGLVGSVFTAGRWLLVGLLSIACIDAGLWFFQPALDWYVGLSGLLHGLLAAGLAATLIRRRGAAAEMWLLAALLTTKLAYEQVGGALPGSATLAGATVIVEAHLYGAVGGLVAGVAISFLGGPTQSRSRIH